MSNVHVGELQSWRPRFSFIKSEAPMPGTLRVEGSSMCAHLSGMIIQPCFRVEKIDYRRFRGSISGLGFAYCDFYQHNPRAEMMSRSRSLRRSR